MDWIIALLFILSFVVGVLGILYQMLKVAIRKD